MGQAQWSLLALGTLPHRRRVYRPRCDRRPCWQRAQVADWCPKPTVTLGQQVAVANRDKSALEMKAYLLRHGGVSLMASTYIDRATAASSGTNLRRVAESMPQMRPKPSRARSGWSPTGSRGRRPVGLQMWKRFLRSALRTPRPNPYCADTSATDTDRWCVRAHRRSAP